MSTPLFFPIVSYAPHLPLNNPLTVSELCAMAGVRCRASGAWTKRQVEVVFGNRIQVIAEPGDWGNVQIVVKIKSKVEGYRFALAIMAYSIQDLVAKESIKGTPWSRIAIPRGRPKTGQALTTKERQRRFRATRA